MASVAPGDRAGIIAALNRNTWIDRVTIVCAVLGHAVPNFVMGFLLVILFSVSLQWLATGGFQKPTDLILPMLMLYLIAEAGGPSTATNMADVSMNNPARNVGSVGSSVASSTRINGGLVGSVVRAAITKGK